MINRLPIIERDPLARVMQSLQELEHHTHLAADASFDERVVERLRQQIPDKIRWVLDSHLRHVHSWLRKRREPEAAEQMFQKIRGRKVRDIHAENLYDSLLSTDENPIHAKRYGISLLQRYLGTMATGKEHPRVLQTYAWISLDLNGVKGMVDCTTYDNVTHYLQAFSRFLLDRNGRTRKWLESQKIKVTPLTAGGDEFALLLDAEGPISQELIDQTVKSLQEEAALREDLNRFLDFDDLNVQLEFLMPNEEVRAAFRAMTIPEKKAYLEEREARQALPKKFRTTFGGGGATLEEGVLRAIELGSLSLRAKKETFDTVRLKIIRNLMELAEARQADNKAEFKKSLAESQDEEDLKLLSFFRRNGENRHLDEKLRDTERRLRETLESLEAAMSTNQDLKAQQDEVTQQLESLTSQKSQAILELNALTALQEDLLQQLGELSEEQAIVLHRLEGLTAQYKSLYHEAA